MKVCSILPLLIHGFLNRATNGFSISNGRTPSPTSTSTSTSTQLHQSLNDRREFLTTSLLTITATTSILTTRPQPSNAGTFTPGGTLVDREVGITVGNPQASPSRKQDNSNVLFTQDNYFKFGTAAPWIEPDSTDFPKTMPFVLSQQRYDALKKYGSRVSGAARTISDLKDTILTSEDYTTAVKQEDDPIYALRAFGLLANGFLGSENTGTTNELLLARWYINEIYLRIGDVRAARGREEALEAHDAAVKGLNSFFAMVNRVITSKVGDKFSYV